MKFEVRSSGDTNAYPAMISYVAVYHDSRRNERPFIEPAERVVLFQNTTTPEIIVRRQRNTQGRILTTVAGEFAECCRVVVVPF